MTKITIITDTAELGKRIDAWGKAGSKFINDSVPLAISALQRLADHGDIGYVNRLYVAMPKGTKTSAMASWLLTHGALQANTGEDKATKPFLYDKAKETNVDAATQDPWYNHKPEPAADDVFDLQKALKALIAKANKATKIEHAPNAALVALMDAAKAAGVDTSAMSKFMGEDDPLAELGESTL